MPSPLDVAAATYPDLTATARLLYAALALRGPGDPYTTADLCAATGLHRLTVYEVMAGLCARGLARTERIGVRNVYRVLLQTIHAGTA